MAPGQELASAARAVVFFAVVLFAVAAVAAVAAGSARSLLVPAVAVGLVAVGLVVVVSARRVAGRPRRATGSAGAVDTPLARPVPTAAD